MVSLRPSSRSSPAPRFATPATPGRPNLAGAIGRTAVLLGFEKPLGAGLMPWQRDVNALAAEAGGGSGPRRRWLIYGALVTLGGYLNEMSLLVLAAHAITVLLARPGRRGGPGRAGPSGRGGGGGRRRGGGDGNRRSLAAASGGGRGPAGGRA